MKQASNLENDGQSTKEELLHQLIDEHALTLKRIIFLYVNDSMEAEDILQEVFVSCYQHLDAFNHTASFKTWMIRIAINKCKDYRKRWSFRNIFYKNDIESNGYGDSADQPLLTKETTDEMIQFLSRLAPKHKKVLILYYYQQLKMDEIADVLEINMNTVKSRLLRAKAKLKKEIEEA